MKIGRPRRHRLAILAGLFTVLAGGIVAARGTLLPYAARWLDVGGPPRSCDYVMVLGGGEHTRPFVAAAMVNVGLAKKVLLTHVKFSDDVKRGIALPMHEINRRILIRRGVAPSDIVIRGKHLEHTQAEAETLAAFIEDSPDVRVTVVTNMQHTRRARYIFKKVLGRRAHQVAFVSAPAYGFRADNWWQNNQGVHAVVGEYLKLAFYWVRYGRVVYWGGASCLIVFLALLAYRKKWCRRSLM